MQFGIKDLESSALCSNNRFSLTVYERPVLTCEEFEDDECVVLANDDLLPPQDEILPDEDVCWIPGPTMTPTLTPTMSPTLLRTMNPSECITRLEAFS